MEDRLSRLETQMAVLARRIEHTARRSTTSRHMDRAAYLIARTLDDGGPASVNEIARALSLDGSTVTRQVAGMEARGQTTRKIHPVDGRAWVINLTPAGRKAMETIRTLRRARFSESLAHWSPADLDTFCVLLQRLNESLANADPPAGETQGTDRQKNRRGEHRQSVLAPRRTR